VVLLHGQRVLPVPLISLVGQSLCLRCSCLSTLLLRKHHARAAVLLVLQTYKNSLALLSPRSLAGEPDMDVLARKPQKDGLGCRHLLCKSSMFGYKATSSLLVKKALTTCSLLAGSLLAFVGGLLVEESLATIGLLACS
jgi:hypothetical protein